MLMMLHDEMSMILHGMRSTGNKERQNIMAQDETKQDEQKEALDLSEAASKVFHCIEENDEKMSISGQGVTDATSVLHEFPVHVPKHVWKELGEAIQVRENLPLVSIPADHWISLRCDGNNFGKLKTKLYKHKILESEYWSRSFSIIMVACCHALMDFFDSKYGYTQSDEITVLLSPTTSKHGTQQPHKHGGRKQKLCSLAASVVSTTFNMELIKLCRQVDIENFDAHYATAIFDCRVGSYESRDEAASLLLWRAYDCGINGVSDAIYNTMGKKNIRGAQEMVTKTTLEKLTWLAQHEMLPLPRPQQSGVYLVKYKKIVETRNKTTPVKCVRCTRHVVTGNLINLWKQGRLFPNDEVLSNK